MKSIYLSEFKMQTTEHKKHWLSIPDIWPTQVFFKLIKLYEKRTL